jgi:hypothetical protein
MFIKLRLLSLIFAVRGQKTARNNTKLLLKLLTNEVKKQTTRERSLTAYRQRTDKNDNFEY